MLDENQVIVLDRNGREKDRYDAANISSARDIARMDRLFGGREADNTRDEFLNRFRPGLRDDVWELLTKYTTDKFNPNRLFPFIEFLSLDGDIKLKELCFQSFLHAGGNKRLFEGLYRGILKVGFNTTGKCESLFLLFFNDVRRITQKGADLGAYNISFDVKYNMSHSFGLPKYDKKNDKKNDRIPTKWAKMLGTTSNDDGEIALFQMLRKMTKSKDNPHPTNAFIFVKKGGETARIIYKEDVVDMINNKRPLKGFSFDLQNGYEGVSMKLEERMRRRNMINEEVSYGYDYDGIAFHLLENIWDSVSDMPEFEDVDHDFDYLFDEWVECWSDKIVEGIERCVENGTLNAEDEWGKFRNDIKNSEVGKILSNAKKDLINAFKGNSMYESHRPHGRMLKEFYFEDPEDASWELNQGEYECCYCGREVTGAEGYCRNDEGEICCIDCYEERFGKNESHRPRGRVLKEESEDYYTYTIPEWTLPYIFNDDPSGLEDDEIEAVDNFVASLPKGWVIDVDEDEDGNTQTFFSHTNDLPGKHGKLGNTCVDVKVTVF